MACRARTGSLCWRCTPTPGSWQWHFFMPSSLTPAAGGHVQGAAQGQGAREQKCLLHLGVRRQRPRTSGAPPFRTKPCAHQNHTLLALCCCRSQLFKLINQHPTLFEVVTGRASKTAGPEVRPGSLQPPKFPGGLVSVLVGAAACDAAVIAAGHVSCFGPRAVPSGGRAAWSGRAQLRARGGRGGSTDWPGHPPTTTKPPRHAGAALVVC